MFRNETFSGDYRIYFKVKYLKIHFIEVTQDKVHKQASHGSLDGIENKKNRRIICDLVFGTFVYISMNENIWL